MTAALRPPELLEKCQCGWTTCAPRKEWGSTGGQGGGWSGKVRIQCVGCTKSTGYLSSESEAIAAWNRHAPAVVIDEGDEALVEIGTKAIAICAGCVDELKSEVCAVAVQCMCRNESRAFLKAIKENANG